MRLDTALLCDAATVREGLLHILGGGITQIIRDEYPAELSVTLALRIMVHPTEMPEAHQLRIVVQGEDGEQITEVRADVRVANPELVPVGEEGELLIPWDFPGRPKLPTTGRYSMEILIDGVHQGTVPFRARTLAELQREIEERQEES
jgi:hypothetical protein